MPVDVRQLLDLIKGGNNPQQLALAMLQQTDGGPLLSNLLTLAQAGNTNEIEKVVRNVAKEKGIDYDKEFNAFKKFFGY